MFNNKNLLMGSSENFIMFKLKYIPIWQGYAPNDVSVTYSYTDPSTKQTVTETVNSTDTEYTWPCLIGDTITFSNLLGKRWSYLGTLFMNGVDISPNGLWNYNSTFSVTVTGESPYIEYYFMYGKV